MKQNQVIMLVVGVAIVGAVAYYIIKKGGIGEVGEIGGSGTTPGITGGEAEVSEVGAKPF